MICKQTVYAFCIEEPSLIENYDKAIADTTQTWHCHHRLEIQGDNIYSPKELNELGLYYHRPASELIFLTKSEHQAVHNRATKKGNKNSLGIKQSKELCKQKSIAMKGKLSGSKHPLYGKHHSTESKLKNSISNSIQYKWLTPSGEIKLMNKANARHYHKDWKLIDESFK